MCGIAGFQRSTREEEDATRSLLEDLASRGPDGAHRLVRAGWCLAQTRLAVVDLSDRVRYPLPNEAGDVHLLFNGEIYDHREMRRRLEGLGHEFRTDCDAEVALHAYEEWGVDGFARLNGMFALAVLDEGRGELLLARDRVGIKPLVRTASAPWAFGSDAIALVRAGLSPGEVDHAAVAEYAAFHYAPHPRTGIAGIEQVEPGTAVVLGGSGAPRIHRWADEPFSGAEPEADVPAEELEACLLGAVQRQLEADVEIGIFLSAGLDSALVAAAAARAGASPRAFTIGFPGQGAYDEAPAASRLAAELGLAHHRHALAPGFEDSVGRVAAAFDQPLADSSAIATLALAELAREQVTVALSGTGGDDLFAGYYRHRAHRLRRVVGILPAPLVRFLAARRLERGAERSGRLALMRSYAIRLMRAGAETRSQYLELVGSMTSAPALGALRSPPDALRAAREQVASRLALGSLTGPGALRELQRFELASYLPGDLLAKEDRATMAVGLEGRVPMLDAEMVALAERMPGRQRAGLRRGKLPLRALAGSLLPAYAGSGPKRGFAVPLHDLFTGPWREPAAEFLRGADSDLIDGRRAAALVDRDPSAAPDAWALAALVGWEARLNDARVAASR